MTPESRTQFEQRMISVHGFNARDFDRNGEGQYIWLGLRERCNEFEAGWQACWSLKEKEVQTLNDMLTSRDERLRSADAYFVNTALEVVELREQLAALKEGV